MGTESRRNPEFVFSIDIEDWFQVENLKGIISYEEWEEKDLRIEASMRTVLDILRRHDITATFFVLGWIAERCPDLVREIAKRGHEIGCHGYGHELLHELSGDELKNDLNKSVNILTPLSSNKIVGYRSPSFSITDTGADTLKEIGFRYDASYNRFQFNRRYGEVHFGDHVMRLKNGLIEFPVTVNSYFGICWPLGGGYFRLSPTWFLRKQLRDAIRWGGSEPVSIYLHPWEFDPGQPRVEGLKSTYRFRHYCGLNRTASKFEEFVKLVKNTSGVLITTFGEVAEKYG